MKNKLLKLILGTLLLVLMMFTVNAVECGATPTDGCDVSNDTNFTTGTYALPSGIRITADVTLDCKDAILNGTRGIFDTATFEDIAITVDADNVIIRNCNITQYSRQGNAIWIDGTQNVLNLEIDNVDVTYTPWRMKMADEDTSVYIENISVHDSRYWYPAYFLENASGEWDFAGDFDMSAKGGENKFYNNIVNQRFMFFGYYLTSHFGDVNILQSWQIYNNTFQHTIGADANALQFNQLNSSNITGNTFDSVTVVYGGAFENCDGVPLNQCDPRVQDTYIYDNTYGWDDSEMSKQVWHEVPTVVDGIYDDLEQIGFWSFADVSNNIGVNNVTYCFNGIGNSYTKGAWYGGIEDGGRYGSCYCGESDNYYSGCAFNSTIFGNSDIVLNDTVLNIEGFYLNDDIDSLTCNNVTFQGFGNKYGKAFTLSDSSEIHNCNFLDYGSGLTNISGNAVINNITMTAKGCDGNIFYPLEYEPGCDGIFNLVGVNNIIANSTFTTNGSSVDIVLNSNNNSIINTQFVKTGINIIVTYGIDIKDNFIGNLIEDSTVTGYNNSIIFRTGTDNNLVKQTTVDAGIINNGASSSNTIDRINVTGTFNCNSTILVGDNSQGSLGLIVANSDLNIEDCNFKNFDTVIEINSSHSNITIDNIEVTEMVVNGDESGSFFIDLDYNSKNVTIQNSRFLDDAGEFELNGDLTCSYSVVDWSFLNNKINSSKIGGVGLVLQGVAGVTINNNNFTGVGNTEKTIGLTGVKDVTISNSKFILNGESDSIFTIEQTTSNPVCENRDILFDNLDMEGDGTRNGIALVNVTNVTIRNSDIRNYETNIYVVSDISNLTVHDTNLSNTTDSSFSVFYIDDDIPIYEMTFYNNDFDAVFIVEEVIVFNIYNNTFTYLATNRVEDFSFYDNTIVGSLMSITTTGLPSDNVDIYNNTLTLSSGLSCTDCNEFLFQDNIVTEITVTGGNNTDIFNNSIINVLSMNVNSSNIDICNGGIGNTYLDRIQFVGSADLELVLDNACNPLVLPNGIEISNSDTGTDHIVNLDGNNITVQGTGELGINVTGDASGNKLVNSTINNVTLSGYTDSLEFGQHTDNNTFRDSIVNDPYFDYGTNNQFLSLIVPNPTLSGLSPTVDEFYELPITFTYTVSTIAQIDFCNLYIDAQVYDSELVFGVNEKSSPESVEADDLSASPTHSWNTICYDVFGNVVNSEEFNFGTRVVRLHETSDITGLVIDLVVEGGIVLISLTGIVIITLIIVLVVNLFRKNFKFKKP